MKRAMLFRLVLLLGLLVVVLQPPMSSGSQTGVAIKDFLGVNAVVNNRPADLAQVAGWVRDYHKWYWYEPVDNSYTWDQPWQYLDNFYSTLKTAGVKVMPSVEFAPGWATSNGTAEAIPNAAKHAEYLGALVRHYGDTIAAVENYNEPDRCCSDGKMTAELFGAMARQDFDAVGAANPSLPRVVAGLSNANTSYMDKVYTGCGGNFDVLNFHWYAVGDTARGGVNPESGNLREQVDEMKGWRDAVAHGKPIWITEFGWDTYAQSDGRKSQIYAPESSAANYLLRALFLMQGLGVEKAFTYIYRDPSDNAAFLHYLYLSSGLVTDRWETDDRKKAGWYYLATLKSVLGDYALDGIVSDGPNIYHYEYVIPGTNQRAAVLWARDGDRDRGYSAAYRGPAGTLVQPVDGSTSGVSSSTDGNLTLSETPVFVLYTGSGQGYQPPSPTPTDGPAYDGCLITNGGFENALQGWTIPSWFSEAVSLSWSMVHSGNLAMRLSGTASGPYVRQEIPVQAGQTVEFKGMANVTRHESSKPLEVVLVPLSQWGGEILKSPIVIASFSSATNGWVALSGTNVMPASTAKIRVQIQTASLVGTAYFDDLSLCVVGGATATVTPIASATSTPTLAATATLTEVITPSATATPAATSTATNTATPTATSTSTPTTMPTSTPTATSAPSSAELLVNSGFESQLQGWYLPSWMTGTVGVSAEASHSGSFAIRFRGRGNGPYLYQEIAATSGQRLDVAGWVNLPQRGGSMTLTLELVARDGQNREKTLPVATVASVTSGWVPVSGAAVVPDKTAKLRLQLRCPTLDGTVYVDELSVKVTGSPGGTADPSPTPMARAEATATVAPAPTSTATVVPAPTSTAVPPTATPAQDSGQERLANGGFEGGLAGWYLPSWFSRLASPADADHHSGGQSFRFQGRGSGLYLYQEVEVAAGERLEFTGWVNVPQRYGTMSLVVELVLRDSANRERVLPIATMTDASAGWASLHALLVVPAGFPKARVQVRLPYLDGTAYLDDFSLRSTTGP